jgi:hypothetical protein
VTGDGIMSRGRDGEQEDNQMNMEGPRRRWSEVDGGVK